MAGRSKNRFARKWKNERPSHYGSLQDIRYLDYELDDSMVICHIINNYCACMVDNYCP
ncbi:Hypothetical predicted protein [Paramuricea clavata]|uniref:Uncharacterized protein n=1 Tax=Paramuricea clavata TaxID=317549 RepID=A0A7D9IIR3_PARCT|nr:Hypothetical predicted protein [Paramuricea clavata]